MPGLPEEILELAEHLGAEPLVRDHRRQGRTPAAAAKPGHRYGRDTRPGQTALVLDIVTLQAVRHAKDRIDVAFAAPLDMRAIASGGGFSTAHFIQMFNAVYGDTPGAYRTRQRVERACDLLRSVNLTVTDCVPGGGEKAGRAQPLSPAVLPCAGAQGCSWKRPQRKP